MLSTLHYALLPAVCLRPLHDRSGDCQFSKTLPRFGRAPGDDRLDNFQRNRAMPSLSVDRLDP